MAYGRTSGGDQERDVVKAGSEMNFDGITRISFVVFKRVLVQDMSWKIGMCESWHGYKVGIMYSDRRVTYRTPVNSFEELVSCLSERPTYQSYWFENFAEVWDADERPLVNIFPEEQKKELLMRLCLR